MKKYLEKKKENGKGFTLVELIVVLVILAILAAILVPALLSYIDRARQSRDLLDAKDCLTAAQTCLMENYAKNGHELKPGYEKPENLITPGKNGKGGAVNANGDVNATGTKKEPNTFSDRVLSLVDLKDNTKRTGKEENNTDDPMVIIMGVGSNLADSDATLHEKYTIYYFMYQKDLKSTPLFYFNGSWSTVNPRTDNSLIKNKYYPQVGPMKGKRLQYYIISNKLIEKTKNNSYTGASNSFWNYVDQFK